MTTESSPLYVQNKKLGALSEISNDWSARLILASSLYFNMINVLDDQQCDEIVQIAFEGGGDAAQFAVAPLFAFLMEEANDGRVPAQITRRVLYYTYAIPWAVTSPFDGFQPSETPILPADQQVLRLVHYDDGDYQLFLGSLDSIANETIGQPLIEMNQLILTGYADVDFKYFSRRDLAMQAAPVVQKYMREKWDFDLKLIEES
ncbi:MAG: hypothetical protein JXR15_12655 [Shimia sp.]|uniref:hypothetical protein n=1 Tax=Shimia sp. TaxID=1954381 RepID=UPI003B8BDB0A